MPTVNAQENVGIADSLKLALGWLPSALAESDIIYGLFFFGIWIGLTATFKLLLERKGWEGKQANTIAVTGAGIVVLSVFALKQFSDIQLIQSQISSLFFLILALLSYFYAMKNAHTIMGDWGENNKRGIGLVAGALAFNFWMVTYKSLYRIPFDPTAVSQGFMIRSTESIFLTVAGFVNLGLIIGLFMLGRNLVRRRPRVTSSEATPRIIRRAREDLGTPITEWVDEAEELGEPITEWVEESRRGPIRRAGRAIKRAVGKVKEVFVPTRDLDKLMKRVRKKLRDFVEAGNKAKTVFIAKRAAYKKMALVLQKNVIDDDDLTEHIKTVKRTKKEEIKSLNELHNATIGMTEKIRNIFEREIPIEQATDWNKILVRNLKLHENLDIEILKKIDEIINFNKELDKEIKSLKEIIKSLLGDPLDLAISNFISRLEQLDQKEHKMFEELNTLLYQEAAAIRKDTEHSYRDRVMQFYEDHIDDIFVPLLKSLKATNVTGVFFKGESYDIPEARWPHVVRSIDKLIAGFKTGLYEDEKSLRKYLQQNYNNILKYMANFPEGHRLRTRVIKDVKKFTAELRNAGLLHDESIEELVEEKPTKLRSTVEHITPKATSKRTPARTRRATSSEKDLKKRLKKFYSDNSSFWSRKDLFDQIRDAMDKAGEARGSSILKQWDNIVTQFKRGNFTSIDVMYRGLQDYFQKLPSSTWTPAGASKVKAKIEQFVNKLKVSFPTGESGKNYSLATIRDFWPTKTKLTGADFSRLLRERYSDLEDNFERLNDIFEIIFEEGSTEVSTLESLAKAISEGRLTREGLASEMSEFFPRSKVNINASIADATNKSRAIKELSGLYEELRNYFWGIEMHEARTEFNNL